MHINHIGSHTEIHGDQSNVKSDVSGVGKMPPQSRALTSSPACKMWNRTSCAGMVWKRQGISRDFCLQGIGKPVAFQMLGSNSHQLKSAESMRRDNGSSSLSTSAGPMGSIYVDTMAAVLLRGRGAFSFSQTEHTASGTAWFAPLGSSVCNHWRLRN